MSRFNLTRPLSDREKALYTRLIRTITRRIRNLNTTDYYGPATVYLWRLLNDLLRQDAQLRRKFIQQKYKSGYPAKGDTP